MIGFEFTRPGMLIALLPAAAVLGWYFRRSLSDFPRPQRIVSLVTRGLLVLLLVFSLAGLTLLHSTDQQFVVFLIDQSLSVGDEGAQYGDAFLSQALGANKKHRVAFLPFAAVTGPIQQQRVVYGDRSPLKGPVAGNAAVPQAAPGGAARRSPLHDGTNLAAAIRTAEGYLPPGYVPHIVVLSDGNETEGDALAAAALSRVPISTVPLPTRSEPEVQVSAVYVPAEVRKGEPFHVEVVIHSNHEDAGLIEVYRGDHKAVSESRPLRAGENRFRFQQSIERERLAAYSVRVSGLKEDTLLDNNMDSGLVYAAGQPRVLIIESDPQLIRELAYALDEEGIQAEVRPPQGVPQSLSDLQNYELLILSNVPATALNQRQMDVVRTYVQDLGGGLMMLGGEQSFGLGGYYKTTLEEILPVRSDFEKEKETPSLAMVLVIDKSGSMSGQKIDMAKSAARAAVDLLGPRDQAAVIAFDGQPYVVSEMQSAANKSRLGDEISRVGAGGGTVMYPALEMAYQMLLSTSARMKHVIVLTDGISSPGDFAGIAGQMASERMTVSTVAVGDGADVQLLESIARIGNGRYYFTNDPAQVPQIFARETVTASKSAIDEQPFLPQVVRATHALADVDMESSPFLLGYVITRPKPTCEVILATEKGDPLLAWWRYGLGMAAAFTSDAKSRWAAEWMSWPGFGKFWTQVIRQTMRKSDARGLTVEIDRRGKTAELTVDAVNDLGQFLNGAEVELTVIDPQMQPLKSAVMQTAPGRYEAALTTTKQGAYHLELAVRQNDQLVYRQSRGLTVGYSDELRIRPTNRRLLRDVAEISGGTYAPNPSALFEQDDATATRPTPLWPHLVAAAALLLAIDVALRRIDFSLFWPFARTQ